MQAMEERALFLLLLLRQPRLRMIYVTSQPVAEATIDVPPGTETLTTVDISLSTIKEATAIEIEYCQLSD